MEKTNWHSYNRGKGILVGLTAMLMLTWLGGCRVERHEHYDHGLIFSTHILSDQTADGDISLSPPDRYYLSSARTTGSVLIGIDPWYQAEECRGFLNFDLRGANGVPWHALIESASLEIFINDVVVSHPGDKVPLFIDLVSFNPPYLIAGDFHSSNLPPLMSLPVDIYPYDTGAIVAIDVTGFMVEAQLRGLSYLQLRLLLDHLAAHGLIEINDAATSTAPLLTVFFC